MPKNKHIIVRFSMLTVLFLIVFGNINSQNISISGYIVDSTSLEKIIGANIFDSTANIGSTSNNYGFFSMSLPQKDTTILKISHVGYATNFIKVPTRKQLELRIALVPGNNLSTVEIVSNNSKEGKLSTIGTINIPIKQANAIPAIGGEPDIMKVLQLRPGVISGSEASSGLLVRGGSPDQNLVLLDDATLYYVNHLGGFISTFNSDAISDVKLLKGGFPANYGGKLSSVLEVNMKDGNMRKFSGSGMVGMIASKISIEGPIKIDTASYIISVRRFMYDLLMMPISEALTQGFGVGYYFYDFNAKFNYRFSSKDRIYLSLYSGDDKLKLKRDLSDLYITGKVKIGQNWGNNLAAFRWNHLYNSRLFSNFVLSYTRYRLLNSSSTELKSQTDKQSTYTGFTSGINDLTAKIDFDFFTNQNFKMKFGMASIYHKFTPGLYNYENDFSNIGSSDTSYGNYNMKAFDFSTYLSNEIKYDDWLFINLGGRLSIYQVKDKIYFAPEPRMLLSFNIINDLQLKFSYAKMHQNIHLLSNSGIGIPSDLWLPSTPKIKPSESSQISSELYTPLFNGNYEVSIDAFYKNMRNLITYKEGENTVNANTDWQDKVEYDGIGKSYGVEFLFKKVTGKTTGWIGYSYSKTTRQFSNINNGLPFNYKYDRTNSISIVLIHNFSKTFNLSITWIFGTGNAITIPVGKYDVINDADGWVDNNIGGYNYYSQAYIYNGINNYRLKAYHRLDIGSNITKKTKWGERTWNFSIYNAYNRQNPFYYFYSSSEGKTVIKQQSLFPIIPSISYAFKF